MRKNHRRKARPSSLVLDMISTACGTPSRKDMDEQAVAELGTGLAKEGISMLFYDDGSASLACDSFMFRGDQFGCFLTGTLKFGTLKALKAAERNHLFVFGNIDTGEFDVGFDIQAFDKDVHEEQRYNFRFRVGFDQLKALAESPVCSKTWADELTPDILRGINTLDDLYEAAYKILEGKARIAMLAKGV